jgi:hypothetical protein
MKPMGLSQADYEELENPRQAAELSFPADRVILTRWQNALLCAACAFVCLLVLFYLVSALLCRMVTGRWPR